MVNWVRRDTRVNGTKMVLAWERCSRGSVIIDSQGRCSQSIIDPDHMGCVTSELREGSFPQALYAGRDRLSIRVERR